MPEIVLTDEQVRVLAEADGAVTVRDPAGLWLGVLDPAEAAILTKWSARKAGGGAAPGGSPAADVESRLRALQAEWDRTGGFDPGQAVEFVRRLRAGG